MSEVRAVVTDGSGNMDFSSLQLEDRLHPDDVLISPIATGICLSDIKLVTTRDGYYPTTLGHEALGRVFDIGSNVSAVSRGDLVLTTVAPVCGICGHCRQGFGNLCLSGGSVVAGSQPDGAFRLTDADGLAVGQYCFIGSLSERFITHCNQLLAIPHHLASHPEVATISCSLSTAAGAVFLREDAVKAGTVAVVGAGSLGTSLLLVLQAVGASDITVIDSDPTRLAHAETLADVRVGTPEDVIARGQNFQTVFESSSYGFGMPFALRVTSRGGECVAIGMPAYGALSQIDHWSLVGEQKTVSGTVTTSRSPWPIYQRLLDLRESGSLRIETIVQKTFSFEDAIVALTGMRDQAFGKALVLNN